MNRADLKTSSQVETIKKIDGQCFSTLIGAAHVWLRTNQQTVNSLNVFPVPDGDTGTNMVLTMQSAKNEIQEIQGTNIGRAAHVFAQGALMGARGNSGVILSQLWRGFARALDNFESMDAALFVRALAEARDTAYKGVVRPVEGTILTVAKDIAIEAEKAVTQTDDMVEMLSRIVKAADESVKRTPELLPILKQAGVVDSGGKGLFYILEGMLRYLRHESLETPVEVAEPLPTLPDMDEHLEIEPGQDYELVIDFRPKQPLDLDDFHENLSHMGTSIQIAEGDEYYRMHIHVPTDNRYVPIDYVMNLGSISKVYIENLVEQMQQIKNKNEEPLILTPVEPGQIAVVAVSPGKGLSRIFASLGVAAIVEGGQTMNPSTEEIISAFKDLPTDKVIILPNNKNIVLAANAAAESVEKNIQVIPSFTIPQGLNAVLQLIPDGDFDTIVKHMKEAILEPQTGEITLANRKVQINGVSVKKGEAIVLLDGNLIAATNDLEDACVQLLEKADTLNRERITFFYGNGLTLDEVNPIVEAIQKIYPDHEIEVLEGAQPHYHFIISIE
jgi:DAK2 domain fusion protein YloV